MILYLLGIVCLYIQPTAEQARSVLRVLDPTINV